MTTEGPFARTRRVRCVRRFCSANSQTARADLELRKQELAELEHGSRAEEIEATQAAMLAAKARWEYAQRDFDRVRGLFETSSAARDEMDEAIKEAQATEQEFRQAKALHHPLHVSEGFTASGLPTCCL